MIPLVDLKKLYARLAPRLRKAVLRVLDSGVYILGPEGKSFEAEFAKALGARHALGVSSGTEALKLALEALEVGPGDEVILPAFTFIATATSVSTIGAVPVFVDVDPVTLTMDPAKARAAVTPRTKVLLPVHLYGYPADMDPILALARERGLKVLEDCAQAHLTTYKNRVAGALGDIAAFSFYPTKNLGAAGDAGAVVTQSAELAQICLELRNVGRRAGANYDHCRIGHNARLDELQAAVLRVKLKDLAKDTARRRRVAALYNKGLAGLPLELPSLGSEGTSHSFHLYVVRAGQRRDELARHLAAAGIGTGVYYPIPIHLQPAYRGAGHKAGDFPESERASRTVLALPMYPDLSASDVGLVCRAIKDFFK